jgi:tetratricopeptide (TPR) repeat protein
MTLDDSKTRPELERLITAAHVYRRRGDYDKAQELIDQALEISPSDLEVREFAADIIYARGNLEKAAEQYKQIAHEDNSRASAEEKYARAIVQIAEAHRQRELLKEMLENPSRFRAPSRSALIAGLLSLAPGFGHVYCNQLIKGIVLFLGAMLSWLLFYAFAPNIPYKGLSDQIAGTITTSERVSYFLTHLSAPAILFACIALFVHIYAIVDAPVIASKTREKREAAELAEPE